MKTLFVLLLLCAHTPFFAQTPDAIVDAPYEPDYAKSLPERHLWKQVRETFNKHRYYPILARYRMKLNCGTCTTAYMDVAFSVGYAGNVTINKIEKARACGGDFPPGMEKDFLQYLKDYPYPAGLRGKSVKLRLGTGLKC